MHEPPAWFVHGSAGGSGAGSVLDEILDDLQMAYPLVMTNIAMENCHRNSEFSHEKHGDFPVRYVNVYQRVMTTMGISLG